MTEKDELDDTALLETSDKEKEENTLMAMLRSMNESKKLMSKPLKRVHVPESSNGPKSAESETAKRPRLNLDCAPTPDTGRGMSDSDSEMLCKNSEGNNNSSLDDDLLDSLSKSLERDEITSAPVAEKLAHIIDKRWHLKLEAGKLKEKNEKYLRPENCPKLVAPRVNKPIWSTLAREVKSTDIRLPQPHQNLAIAGRAVLKSTIMLLEARTNKSRPNLEELISVHTDILALLGHTSADIALLRRENIRQSLNEEYKALCAVDIPITNHLFGNEEDLQTHIKVITETNKISKAASRKEQSQRSPRVSSQHGRDSRKMGSQSFLRKRYSNRDQNYQRQSSWRKRNYSSRGRLENNKPMATRKLDQK